jgi:hypothetical protein
MGPLDRRFVPVRGVQFTYSLAFTRAIGRDEALSPNKSKENHLMYTTPKIIASLDANVVLSEAQGIPCGSHCVV